MMLYDILVWIHVAAVIIGLGPTFSFSILGGLAQSKPEWAPALTEALHRISNKVTIPVFWGVAILAGIALMFIPPADGFPTLASNLGENRWLIESLGLIVVAGGVVHGMVRPASEKMYAMIHGKAEMDGAQMQKLAKKIKNGSIAANVIALVILYLMLNKP